MLEECGELVLWLESRGFDLRELFEDGEELLDNALLLYYLLEDVADGSCRAADVWRGGRESAGMRRPCTSSACTERQKATQRGTGEWR